MAVNQELLRQLAGKTPEELSDLESRVSKEYGEPGGFLPRVGAGLGRGLRSMLKAAPSIILEGKAPTAGDDMAEKINTMMATEAVKRKYEAEDPLNVAKRRAIEKFSAPETQSNDEDLWKDIPEDDRKFYRVKKTYQNIDGVPVVIDQEVEETAAGKRAMAVREKEEESKSAELKTKKERAEKAIPIVDELLRNQSLRTASGGGAMLSGIPGTGWKTAGAKLDQLKGILTLDNLGLMKGVLSDADIRILTNAATSLRQDMPYADLTRELTTIRETFKKALSGQSSGSQPTDERNQAKNILLGKGYSDQEAEQLLGQ